MSFDHLQLDLVYPYKAMSDFAAIRVALLGKISIIVDGQETRTFRSNRVPALLGFLLLNPGTHPRELVAQTLWPNTPEEQARHNLRQTLLYLKQTLAGTADALEVSREYIGATASAFSSDVGALLATEKHDEFDSKKRSCEEAVSGYHGLFLPGLDDEWISEARELLSALYLRALVFLSDAEMETNPTLALNYAEKAINEEPLRNAPRARKIRALISLGERAAAHLEYESFADLLDQELGVAPADIVREALDDAPKTRQRFIPAPDRSSVSSDIEFAFQSLCQGDRPHLALDLAISLTPHWIEVGTPNFGLKCIEQAIITADSRGSEPQLIEAKLCAAELKIAQGDTSSAEEIAEDINTALAAMPTRLLAKLRFIEGRLLLTKIHARESISKMEEALGLLTEKDNASLRIDILIQISAAARFISEFDRAFSAANEALNLAENLGEKMAVGSALLRKAQALEVLDRMGEAEECARLALINLNEQRSPLAAAQRLALYRLLESFEQLVEAEEGYRHVLNDPLLVENKFVEVLALTYLGDLVQATGRPREAVALHRRAVEIRRHYDQQLGVATSLRGLGKALYDLGEIQNAQDALCESADLFQREDALPGYASVILALAQIEAGLGNDDLAIRLARRARKFLSTMTLSELKTIGRSGVTAIHDAEALIRSCSSTA